MATKVEIGNDMAEFADFGWIQTSNGCFNGLQSKAGIGEILGFAKIDWILAIPGEHDIRRSSGVVGNLNGADLLVEREVGEVHFAGECDGESGTPDDLSCGVDAFVAVGFKGGVD